MSTPSVYIGNGAAVTPLGYELRFRLIDQNLPDDIPMSSIKIVHDHRVDNTVLSPPIQLPTGYIGTIVSAIPQLFYPPVTIVSGPAQQIQLIPKWHTSACHFNGDIHLKEGDVLGYLILTKIETNLPVSTIPTTTI